MNAQEGRELFKAAPPRGQTNAPSSTTGGWSIMLASVYADDPAELDRMASEALQRFQTKGGLPQAFLEKRGRGVVIAYGRYSSPDSESAQADLRAIHETEIDGGRPFTDAFLAPPPGEAFHGANPLLDLRNARKNHGGKKAAYTLQIGAYARPDRKAPTPSELKEFREAAEKAAAQLRRDGELAFYFHGPNSSSVTVGVFGIDDIQAASGKGPSAAVRDAKLKHPHNLLNGQGVNERAGVAPDGKIVYRLQPSMVVGIPE